MRRPAWFQQQGARDRYGVQGRIEADEGEDVVRGGYLDVPQAEVVIGNSGETEDGVLENRVRSSGRD